MGFDDDGCEMSFVGVEGVGEEGELRVNLRVTRLTKWRRVVPGDRSLSPLRSSPLPPSGQDMTSEGGGDKCRRLSFSLGLGLSQAQG